MKCTATQLRKTLFDALERASHGEPLEVIYKGSVIHLNPGPTPPGKLARAKRQHALLVDPDAIIGSDPDLLSTMEAEAQEDWKAL